MEIFRIAPVNAVEILLGKYIAFGLLNAVIATVVTALLVVTLGVPFLGSPMLVAGVIALLVLASLGLGLLISVISDSERQAVQLSLLVLLASVFFSGFVISIDEFLPAVRNAAYVLPVTHGIRLIQDLLLRGTTTAWWEVWALGIIAAALFLATWLLLRRSMMRA
jgi:ABC-2 type transport system permease protein